MKSSLPAGKLWKIFTSMKLWFGASSKLYYHFQQRFLCIEYMYCNLEYYLVVHDSCKWYTLGSSRANLWCWNKVFTVERYLTSPMATDLDAWSMGCCTRNYTGLCVCIKCQSNLWDGHPYGECCQQVCEQQSTKPLLAWKNNFALNRVSNLHSSIRIKELIFLGFR